MEVFQPLVDFYDAICDDVRIPTTHISLYMALLYECHQEYRINIIVIIPSDATKRFLLSLSPYDDPIIGHNH